MNHSVFLTNGISKPDRSAFVRRKLDELFTQKYGLRWRRHLTLVEYCGAKAAIEQLIERLINENSQDQN